MANATGALSISFDNGLGSLGNAWNIDQSVHGQITLAGPASIMEWAVGPASGHGYGTYTVQAQVNGNQPGPGIIFWPGDNQWPGQEIDLLEITPNGSGAQYGTLHWNQGGDAYEPQVFWGVSSGVPHEYQMIWEPGHLTMKVDGTVTASFTDHVPVDFTHGGMNNTIGFLNTNSHTSLTVFQVDYVPLGSGAAPVVAAPVVAAPVVVAAAVDWNALAAQVEANFAATGSWDLNAPAIPAPPVAAAVDWNAIAAQVEANFAATGSWHL